MLEGLPEMPIRGIVLDEVRIRANKGLAMVDADAITLRGVEIASRPARCSPSATAGMSRSREALRRRAPTSTCASTAPLPAASACRASISRTRRGRSRPAPPFPLALVLTTLALTAPAAGMHRGGPVVWTLDNLARIGGYPVTVVGTPRVVSTPVGKAIEFNGATDGLVLDVNPIEGLTRFTVEALVEPAPDGPEEQRFLHISETGSERRLMMETRILPDHSWCLDTYLRMEAPGLTLIDRAKTHPAGRWHAASLTYDGKTMTSYVDGVRELSGEVVFEPLKAGRVSIWRSPEPGGLGSRGGSDSCASPPKR